MKKLRSRQTLDTGRNEVSMKLFCCKQGRSYSCIRKRGSKSRPQASAYHDPSDTESSDIIQKTVTTTPTTIMAEMNISDLIFFSAFLIIFFLTILPYFTLSERVNVNTVHPFYECFTKSSLPSFMPQTSSAMEVTDWEWVTMMTHFPSSC